MQKLNKSCKMQFVPNKKKGVFEKEQDEEDERRLDEQQLLMKLHSASCRSEQISNDIVELESLVDRLTDYQLNLAKLADQDEDKEDCEWKTRWEIQKTLNQCLLERNALLNSEIDEVQGKLGKGQVPLVWGYEMKSLSGPEAALLVERLENAKKDLGDIFAETEIQRQRASQQLWHHEKVRTSYKKKVQQLTEFIEIQMVDFLTE